MGKIVKLIVPVVAVGLLAGCGNSVKVEKKSGYKGVFVDSAVAGISFSCGGVTGTTDANGVFGVCPKGESVTFSVGNVELGTVKPTEDNIFTPQDLVGVPRDTKDNEKVNLMASLLLSLDSDGDPSNGVNITEEIVTAFTAALPSPTSMNTLSEDAIAEAVESTSDALPAINLEVVPVTEAASHLVDTVVAIDRGDIKPPVQPNTTDQSTN